VADSNLTCYAIDMENPVPAVDGDMAAVTCTSIPITNSYDRPMRSPIGGPRVSDASCGSASALTSSASLCSALKLRDIFRMNGTHCYQRIDGK
jgi:hypothetical protein